MQNSFTVCKTLVFLSGVREFFKQCSHASRTQTLDEKSNLHKVCFVQTCCKYQPCQGLHPLRKWWLPSLHTLCKLGNHHLRNGCKPIQSQCLQRVCTRQTLCKFDFSSSETSIFKLNFVFLTLENYLLIAKLLVLMLFCLFHLSSAIKRNHFASENGI